MSRGPRPPEPAGYSQLEDILGLIDLGEGRLVVGRRLRAMGDHPIAVQALELVQQDRLRAAADLIAAALARVAGNPAGDPLPWYVPKHITKPESTGSAIDDRPELPLHLGRSR